jgi:hypothetical protein
MSTFKCIATAYLNLTIYAHEDSIILKWSTMEITEAWRVIAACVRKIYDNVN